MTWYRRSWTAVACVLAVVGAASAVTASPGNVLAVACAVAIGGATLSAAVSCLRGRRWDQVACAAVSGALVCGTAVAALIGFTLLFGGLGFALSVAVLVASPQAAAACSRWMDSGSTSPPSVLQTLPAALSCASPGLVWIDPVLAPRSPTHDELWQEWIASGRKVRGEASVGEQVDAVARRQQLLDELERRHPRGFAAWLADPEQPLDHAGGAGRLPVDWDALLHELE